MTLVTKLFVICYTQKSVRVFNNMWASYFSKDEWQVSTVTPPQCHCGRGHHRGRWWPDRYEYVVTLRERGSSFFNWFFIIIRSNWFTKHLEMRSKAQNARIRRETLLCMWCIKLNFRKSDPDVMQRDLLLSWRGLFSSFN